jgi:mono/diheme cytochrome c family protein
VLARIDWPGKPGAASPVTPLTAAEQQRFDAGREVYRNVCQSCHQPDGRGLERVAPPLVGSVLALAPAEIASRILLNGKEGPVGLMPPIGSTLNDDQIAAVLTYVRREWGQTGDPVDPATVRTTRAQTASRTRPWTHDELLAMLPPDVADSRGSTSTCQLPKGPTPKARSSSQRSEIRATFTPSALGVGALVYLGVWQAAVLTRRGWFFGSLTASAP